MQPDSSLPIYGHRSDGSGVNVYDFQMKSWPMRFRTSGGNAYLTGRWSRFAQAKQQSGGDTIAFYELNYPYKVMKTQKNVRSICQVAA